MSVATIGQYRITGSIGKGGMGAVYAAEHTLLGRPAAVKVLLPEVSQNQEIVGRFFNEARAATAIRHPGIVEIYDFGYHADGSAYIVMEMLDGEPLAARIARGRVALGNALAIVRQIAGALTAAHAKGIVHRDLKPENVFLVPDPEVPGGERIKLLDFGIAKLASDTPHGKQTRTGAVMGTPTYMAPEQCRGVAVDARADLYSLGCILFELCTGQTPFVGEGVGDVLAAHIHVPPPAVTSFAPDVPRDVEMLVQRLLIKDPNQRLQRSEDLISAIDQLGGGASYRTVSTVSGLAMSTPALPMQTTLSGSSRSYAARVRPHRSRTTLFAVLGAAVAGAAIVVAVLSSGGGAKDEALPIAAPAPPDASVTAAPTEPPAPGASPAPAPTPVPMLEPGEPLPATVDVTLTSDPPGAAVLLDGRELGKTPYTGTLPRGDREATLLVRLKRHKDAKVVARTDAAIVRAVTLERKKVGDARPAAGARDQSLNPF